jgi:hypothetical protein
MAHAASGSSIDFGALMGGLRLMLTLEDGEGAMRRIELWIDGSAVPPWRGNGKNKQFSVGESIEDAVIVSKGGRLWTTN